MPLFDCNHLFIGCNHCFCIRNIGIGKRWVDIFIFGGSCVGEDGERLAGLVQWMQVVDLVHEAVKVVNLIVEVVIGFRLVF